MKHHHSMADHARLLTQLISSNDSFLSFNFQFSFVTCCVRSEEPVTSHRQSLANTLTERGWRKTNDSVAHTCGCYSQSQRTRSIRRGLISDPDVCQLFGLVGAPLLILLDSSGQQTNKLVNTIFSFMSLKRAVAEEIITNRGPFRSGFAVHMMYSIYDRFRPIPLFGDSCSSISKHIYSLLTPCKSFVLFRLHIMARPVQLSKRLKFSCICATRLFASE